LNNLHLGGNIIKSIQENTYLFCPQEFQQWSDQMPVQVFRHLARQIELGHVSNNYVFPTVMNIKTNTVFQKSAYAAQKKEVNSIY